MFDDPRRELRRMEAELLAAEQEEQGQTGDPDAEIPYDAEDEDWLREAKALIGDAPSPQPLKRRGPRNDAVDFRRMAYADEAMDDSQAVFVEKKKRGKKQKEKGVGCLPLVAVLELAAIGVLAWWWYRWLR